MVHDADGVDDATMLAFARETRQTETTFVQSSSEADYRCRIFMTRGEVPFAGHPSLGTAAAVALARGETGAASYVQQTHAGLQPIDVEVVDERTVRTSMLQEPVTFGPELDPAVPLAAAGIDPALADPSLPAQVVATGVPQVLAPVRPEALRELRPDFRAIEALVDEHSALTVYLAAVSADGTARARALYPDAASVGEDPATGSAAGPLLAYLHARRGDERLRIEQGVEMGRPSGLECTVEGDRVRVGGDTVVVATGTVLL